MIILFFGQPASGKTTLANAFFDKMKEVNPYNNFIRLDGDEWRDLSNNKDYSKEGRVANLKSAFTCAKFLNSKGFNPVLSFVTPYEELRTYLGTDTKLFQIYLEYNIDRGRTNYFANDFEKPKGCYLSINTSEISIDDCVNIVRNFCIEKK